MKEHRTSTPQGPAEHSSQLRFSMRRRVAGGLAWVGAGRVAYTTAAAALGVLVARLLPPEGAGTALLGLSIATSLGVAAELGLRRVATRAISTALGSGHEARARSIIVKIAALSAASGTIFAVVLMSPVGVWGFATAFPDTELHTVSGTIGVLVGLRAIAAIRADIFRGLQSFGLASIFDRLDGTAITVLVLGALGLGLSWSIDIQTVFRIAFFAWVPGLLLGAVLLVRRCRYLPSGGSTTSSQLLGRAWPLWLEDGSLIILTQADLWIVGALLGAEEAALYGVPLRMLALVSLPLAVSNGVLSPMVARLEYDGQYGRLEHLLRTMATVGTLPAFGVVLLFALVGRPFLSVAFGEFYAGSWSILLILCIGHLVNAWMGSSGMTLAMSGRERLCMWVSLSGAAVMIVLVTIGALALGVIGAAIGASVGMALKHVAMWWGVRSALGLRTDVRLIGVAEGLREVRRVRSHGHGSANSREPS